MLHFFKIYSALNLQLKMNKDLNHYLLNRKDLYVLLSKYFEQI